MERFIKFFALHASVAYVFLFFASCNGEDLPVAGTVGMEFDAAFAYAGEDAVKADWKAGDRILYYSKDKGLVGTFDVPSDASAAVLEATLESDATFLVAVSGGRNVTDHSGSSLMLKGCFESNQSGLLEEACVAVAKSSAIEDRKLDFQVVSAALRFSISGDEIRKVVFTSIGDETIQGNGTIKITFTDDIPSASSSETGGPSISVDVDGPGTYFMGALPATLSQGCRIDFFDADGFRLSSSVKEDPLTLTAGRVLDLGIVDQGGKTVAFENLSILGTANCYLVPEHDAFKFKATVKGCTSDPLDNRPVKAQVLWESFGTSKTPKAEDVVGRVTYGDGFVSFYARNDGNAVVAVLDEDDNILWSWHLWVCEGYDPEATAQAYNSNAGTLMDRDLGAMCSTPGDDRALGLMYQWGRKDPFPGAMSMVSQTGPDPVQSSSRTGTIEYAVAHPATFIKNYSDWLYKENDAPSDGTRWDDKGGMYDPCPCGWRVPDGGPTGVWATAFGTTDNFDVKPSWDSTKKGIDFGLSSKPLGSGVIWYPAGGVIFNDSGLFELVGNAGYWWSCTSADDDNGYSFSYTGLNYARTSKSVYPKGHGMAVRCMKR